MILNKPFAQFDKNEWDLAIASNDKRFESAIQAIESSPYPLTQANTFVGHSGGKDSVVVRYLTDRAFGGDGTDFATIHTTKPPGVENEVHEATRLFLYGLQRHVLYMPLECFNNLGPFKYQIDGTRRSEHDRSNGRAIDVVIDGQPVSRKDMPQYVENGLFGLSFVYPIVDWTDAEVWALIYARGLPYSPEYDL